MKKIALILSLLAIVGFVNLVFAESPIMFTDVTISVDTYPVVGAGSGTAGVPNRTPEISSATAKTYISKIRISNSDASIPQTVTFYDDVRTTNTVTTLWEVIFATGTAIPQTIVESFKTERPLRADYGLYIRKTSVSSTISASVLYW